MIRYILSYVLLEKKTKKNKDYDGAKPNSEFYESSKVTKLFNAMQVSDNRN